MTGAQTLLAAFALVGGLAVVLFGSGFAKAPAGGPALAAAPAACTGCDARHARLSDLRDAPRAASE